MITENRLKEIFEKYMSKFDWSVEDFGDIAVYADGKRVFDTFEDYLSINPFFLDGLQTFFGDSAGDLLLDWFNSNFEFDSHPATDWGPAEFYDEEEEQY